MVFNFNWQLLMKYFIEGAAVALVAYFIPQKKTALGEVAVIALVAAAMFAVLDHFAPAVALGARQGSGFGIGYNLVGGSDDEPDVDTDTTDF